MDGRKASFDVAAAAAEKRREMIFRGVVNSTWRGLPYPWNIGKLRLSLDRLASTDRLCSFQSMVASLSSPLATSALPGHISLLHPVGLALARPAVFFSTSTF
jgi:hypothetical protein